MRDFSAANAILLEQRLAVGDALESTHRVQHFCFFANQYMAQAAVEAFEAAGFDTEIVVRTMKSQVMVMHFLRLSKETLNHACEDVCAIVDHFAGEYAGWDSPIMPKFAVEA